MGQDDGKTGEDMKSKYGFLVVALGLVVLLVAFLASVFRLTSVNDITAALGSVTGTIGTLVGAFFGVQAGAAGKERAEAARDKAEDRVAATQAKLNSALALMNPTDAQKALSVGS